MQIKMNKLVALFIAIVMTIVAGDDKLQSNQVPTRRPSRVPTWNPTKPLLDYSYTCPPGSVSTTLNTNNGAILDRLNVRCNDRDLSQFPDIGGGVGWTTNIKNPVIRLPSGAKGWDRMDVGYQYWAPKGREVVVSFRICAKGVCFTVFKYGLSICSPIADDYAHSPCTRIETYDEFGNDKVINGFETTYSATYSRSIYGNGYITYLKPKFINHAT